jgi:NAD(P)H-dependent nitrite reductase small subunit
MRVLVCPVEELPPGAARVVEVGDRRIAVFNVDGRFLAIDDRCAHKGGSLAAGMVHAGVVTCPLHWWRYDLATGRRMASDTIVQAQFEVEISDGEIAVEVPDAAVAGSMREMLLRHAAEWNAMQEADGES